ncbi:helix-turn-helix transcriptional regulator [Nakamurella sp. A5-74]|uniref:Helix-turn-helix transcriptional regulator n=1 Tax=Nakamurella sp. A5-74 TaxID=3158264 RepID=A0AAU8DRX0_9ACTN
MPTRTVAAPASYLASGTWPTGKLVNDAPPGAVVAQHVARRLKAELEGQKITNRDLGRRANIAHTTIGRALSGETYLDVPALAAIEQALGLQLWPDREKVDEVGTNLPPKR